MELLTQRGLAMGTESRVESVRLGLVCYFHAKTSYRKGLAQKYPWDASKNDCYARSLERMADFVRELPDDDPYLVALTGCEELWSEYDPDEGDIPLGFVL